LTQKHARHLIADVRHPTFTATAVAFLAAIGCSHDGTLPVCGNGTVEYGEACDDGNRVDGDGCTSRCRIEDAATCPAGAQDRDGDGVCSPSCIVAIVDCHDHGQCSDESGTTVCVCTSPWVGAACDACELGYSLSGGNCVANTGLTCTAPRPLPLYSRSLTGTTVGAGDDTQASCADDSGPDVTFVFTFAGPTHGHFLLEGDFDTVLYLRTSCAIGDFICNDDIVPTIDRNSELDVDLPAGTFYLFVDSWQGDQGYFTLTYEFTCQTGMFDPAMGDCTGDPCRAHPCSHDQICIRTQDWSDYSCVCAVDTVAYNGACIDDPCLPNPCASQNRTACSAVLPTGHNCACNNGYIDVDGTCEIDPNGVAWTFMVYMNADNNLEDAGYADLAEMKAAGSSVQVNVVVLFDSMREPTQRLFMEPNGARVLANLGELDMGDWHTLADFGAWAVQAYPARHYALVLWDHGDGWKRMPTKRFKSISLDSSGSATGISIAQGEYAAALSAITTTVGARLDLVGFDACLMGMWELAEATAPFANTLVGSEALEPDTGWSYTQVLQQLTGAPEMSADALGGKVADTYFTTSSDSSTMSVINLEVLAPLTTAMSGLADALRIHTDLYSHYETVRSNTLGFGQDYDSFDLWAFVSGIKSMSGVPSDLSIAANTLLVALNTAITHNHGQAADYGDAHGLAVYLPARGQGMDLDYLSSSAVWSTNTTWDEFLADFTDY
jgi:cysteine-rich repeat protein